MRGKTDARRAHLTRGMARNAKTVATVPPSSMPASTSATWCLLLTTRVAPMPQVTPSCAAAPRQRPAAAAGATRPVPSQHARAPGMLGLNKCDCLAPRMACIKSSQAAHATCSKCGHETAAPSCSMPAARSAWQDCTPSPRQPHLVKRRKQVGSTQVTRRTRKRASNRSPGKRAH